jgi:K+-transporting ATPase ATPase A chain
MIAFAIPILVICVTVLLSWPLGRYMRWAMDPAVPGPRRQRWERIFARVLGRAIDEPQDWKRYALSMLAFNLVMFVLVYVILTVQGSLPLNPDGKTGLEASLAFNTAASFTNNTNLQHYSGEQ